MAAERTPYHFRPMDELDHEETVEFSLRNGRVVHGRMLKGIITPGTRSYYYRQNHEPIRCEPIGWRDLITPDTVAAWQKDKAA
jgi:hypothetical protein